MPKKILYINACVRKNSRTKRLADCLVSRLDGETEEVRLEDICFGISDERFISGRDRLLAAGVYDHPMFGLARSFAAALGIADHEIIKHGNVDSVKFHCFLCSFSQIFLFL